MRARLAGICFLSGFAALLFEHVFFRKASIAFGSSVLATSIVLGAFMAGLAIGGLVASYRGDRLRRPLLAYAQAEAVVGATGVTVALITPHVGDWLSPWIGPLLDRPLPLSAVRAASAFLLMCLPTTAMGFSLPVLARAAEGLHPHFGVVLGRLYGWNTLGAMAGALAGELFLYTWLGIRGTAFAAMGLCAMAALSAAVIARSGLPAAEPRPAAESPALPAPRLLLAAALSGALLLALEVVWARFFQLFVSGTSQMFAVLLAAVLAGIGAGGLLAAILVRRWPTVHRHVAVLCFAAGSWVAGGYAWLRELPGAAVRTGSDLYAIALLSAAFVLPVALASGVLFSLLGTALKESGESARSIGRLAFFNSLGAMTGALAAGFLLLPRAGMERSFLGIAAGYGAVAVLMGVPGWRKPVAWGTAALWLVTVALFPHGLMRRTYLARPLGHVYGGGQVVAVREGLLETIVYVEAQIDGVPYEHRLITNTYSMSATGFVGRRYMKLYVYLPAALHPGLRKALLISYGVGSTAKALTDTSELEAIDVVDISPDILELSSIVYPDPAAHPLRDPRVRVHVEDGRLFLQTTAERYDLITAEPPPPKMAGVVNLYSEEFFRLAREKLNPGGYLTYWLPLSLLEKSDAQAIVAAFCRAFPDCTLWKGGGLSWMLMGSREPSPRPDPERFARQWSSPVATEMRTVGFEAPEQLGALFIMDAPALRDFVAGTAPLTDDFPHRLSPAGSAVSVIRDPWHVAVGDVSATRPRFESSEWIARHWPETFRGAAEPAFEWQAMYDRMWQWDRPNDLRDLDRVLTATRLETLPLVLTKTTPDLVRAAETLKGRGADTAFVWAQEGRALLARRDFEAAARSFAEARRRDPETAVALLHSYALLRAGRPEAALSVMEVKPNDPDLAHFNELLMAAWPATRRPASVQ